jgi:hypothetical protein
MGYSPRFDDRDEIVLCGGFGVLALINASNRRCISGRMGGDTNEWFHGGRPELSTNRERINEYTTANRIILVILKQAS